MDSAQGHRAARKTIVGAVLVIFLSGALGGCAYYEWQREQADVHTRLGIAFLGSYQFHEAMKELLAAESYDPSDPKIHCYLGIAYHGKGLNEKAIEEFQKALALKPDYSEASNYLGTLYVEAGRWDDAIASFERALANVLYDTPSAALYNTGWAYYKKGNGAKALENYQAALRSQPSPALVPHIEKAMGLVKLDEGKVEDALVHFRKSVEMAPSLAESHYWMGICYERMGNRQSASLSYKKVIEIAPSTDMAQRATDRLNALR
jgi:type IV pilus assembly protein PilF